LLQKKPFCDILHIVEYILKLYHDKTEDKWEMSFKASFFYRSHYLSKPLQTKRGKDMTYEKIFSDIQKNFKKAKISDFTREFAFQFNITGEGEGIFYAAYKNGVLSVEPYDYKDRDVIFTADGKTLIAIASGKLEPIYAINDGKLSVDGNQDLAKELMLLINHEKKAETKAAKSTPVKKEANSEATEAKEEKTDEKQTEPAAKAEEKLTAEVKSASPDVAEEVKAPEKEEEKKPASIPAAANVPSKNAVKAAAKVKSKKNRRK